MEHVYYEFPVYAGQIIERVRSADWFIHSFNLDDKDDAYNPAAYLYNAEFFGKSYTVYLDLNIYQYAINAFKKENINELHRDAIALMVFGKFTNILFDPTLAIYEKVNYLSKCPDEITNDLGLFRQIDNADMDDMAMFALGDKADIILPNSCFVDHDKVKLELTKYRRLKKWDSLYLYVLVITKLHQDQDLTNEEKLLAFIRWCHEEFGYSLVALSFLIALIGQKPKPKLMKYNAKASLIEKKKSLLNMTWDLFLLDKFFEYWVGKPSSNEFIYASNDKPLKYVLELAISIQVRESSSHLTGIISDRVIHSINRIQSIIEGEHDQNRKMFNAPNFQQYRSNLIEQNEKVLLT
jgi:hypothetical protein